VFIAAAVLALSAPRPTFAQSGWLPTTWFTGGDVDPKAMFPLAEKDGPWLVLAMTFRGEGAREDARKLVQELRGSHRLTAFTHEKAFDYTGEQRGMGLNPDGTPKRMRYANEGHVVEVAVLVGDFASAEDPRAQKMLQKVKQLRPQSLEGTKANRLENDFIQANRDHVGGAGAVKPPLHTAPRPHRRAPTYSCGGLGIVTVSRKVAFFYGLAYVMTSVSLRRCSSVGASGDKSSCPCYNVNLFTNV
jgi:hypothetical protein